MLLADYDRAQKLRRPPPGRARQAAENVQRIADELGFQVLAPFTDATMHAARGYVLLRARRTAQRAARGDGRAARIDKAIDTRVGFIYETARRYAVELPESVEGEAGQALIRRYFGQGLKAVVGAQYEEELILVEHLVDGLRGADAVWVETLTIGHHLEVIEGLLPEYRAALSVEDKVTAGEVGAAYEALQMRYLEMVWAAFTYVRDAEARAQVLAPVFEQDARLAALYVARRRGQPMVGRLDLDAEAEEQIVEVLAAEQARREAAASGAAEADGPLPDGVVLPPDGAVEGDAAAEGAADVAPAGEPDPS